MRIILPSIALLASTLSGFWESHPVNSPGKKTQAVVEIPGGPAKTPLGLTANNLSIAMGQPSLVLMSSGSMQIPVWSLSGAPSDNRSPAS